MLKLYIFSTVAFNKTAFPYGKEEGFTLQFSVVEVVGCIKKEENEFLPNDKLAELGST